MTGRRGAEFSMGFIIVTAILLVVLIVSVVMVYKSKKGVDSTLACTEDKYECKPFHEWCGDEEAHLSGIMGCALARAEPGICCSLPGGGGGGSGGSSGPKLRAATISLTRVTGETISSGQPVVLIPERFDEFIISGTVDTGADEDQEWGVNITAEDSLGNRADDYVESPNLKMIAEAIKGDIDPKTGRFSYTTGAIRIDPSFTGEYIEITIAIFPINDSVTTLEQSLQKYDNSLIKTYKYYFNVENALRHAGLTQAWSQSKTVTAGCEYVNCKEMYFQVTKSNAPDACEASKINGGAITDPSTVPFMEDEIQYCVWKNNQWGGCQDTVAECIEGRDRTVDVNYNAALDAMLAQLAGGLTTEEQVAATTLSTFAHSQSQQTAYCVQKWGKLETLYRTSSLDLTSQRARFELNTPEFSGQHLCLYGADHDGKLYSAGPPQQIKIDLVAPKVTVDFKPMSLRLIFTCEDIGVSGSTRISDVSGCKDGYGLAYIDNVVSFIQALVNRNNMNSIAWCPSYITGGGYFTEYRDEIVYTDPAIKVLCVRAEDNAGNVGISMVTVYNSYDIFFAALAEALD